jgi:hypothetical protein
MMYFGADAKKEAGKRGFCYGSASMRKDDVNGERLSVCANRFFYFCGSVLRRSFERNRSKAIPTLAFQYWTALLR